MKFVITKDLVDRLGIMPSVKYDKSKFDEINKIEDTLIDLVKRLVPKNIEILQNSPKSIRKKMFNNIENKCVLTLDEAYVPDAKYVINVCGSQSGALKLIPRQGFPHVNEQLAKITANEVALVDSGSKSGWTIREIITLLAERNIRVNEILLGVMNIKIMPGLQALAPCRAVHIVDMFEWLETHDLLLPNRFNKIPKIINNYRIVRNNGWHKTMNELYRIQNKLHQIYDK